MIRKIRNRLAGADSFFPKAMPVPPCMPYWRIKDISKDIQSYTVDLVDKSTVQKIILNQRTTNQTLKIPSFAPIDEYKRADPNSGDVSGFMLRRKARTLTKLAATTGADIAAAVRMVDLLARL